MKIGISTASLYPTHTEKALLEVANLGVKNVEIFLNSITEFMQDGEVFSTLKQTIADYNLNLISVHPFSSPLETVFLFSSYDRRIDEIIDWYKRYFEVMRQLNAHKREAGIFVLHGAIESAKCPDERYVERLNTLIDIGREFGVTVAQENVSYCKSGKLEFLSMLKKELGGKAKFVLDIKQARRAKRQPREFIELLGEQIVHLHLSDGIADSDKDCLPIGEGDFDFAEMFALLKQVGYEGDAVVELYRDNFTESADLAKSVEILEGIVK